MVNIRIKREPSCNVGKYSVCYVDELEEIRHRGLGRLRVKLRDA